jgi:hypothetical protein
MYTTGSYRLFFVTGVWTLEQKGEEPNVNVTFESAQPTLTHMAILALEYAGMVVNILSMQHYLDNICCNKFEETL